MSEIVDNEIRDKVMANILAKPQNQVCFDCGSKAPKWSSPYLGIVICYECSSKHRSYGTHISFVRSVDLDNWKRKELKSLELTGNSYTKERFNDLGVPMIGGNYDYNNSMVLKVRKEIEEMVKESLGPNEYKKTVEKKEEQNEIDNININEEEQKEDKKEKKKEKEEKKEEKEEEKEEIKKPQSFQINAPSNAKKTKFVGKAGKKNKIKKMDFNFDFDSFNDVNFSDMTNNNEKDKKNDKNKEDKEDKDDEYEQKEKEKEKELEDEGNNKSYNIKMSKKEINNKFKNKKAISSEDYAALERGDSDNKVVKDRIKSMGNSQAISSEDVFGSSGENNVYEGESMTEKLKDMALNFTLSAAEKAKQLKNKTNEFINKVQTKLGGNGY